MDDRPSAPRPAPAAGARLLLHVLDAGSLRTVRGFAVRAALFGAYAAIPWLLGLGSALDVATRLLVAFTVGSSFAMIVAVARGEPAGRGVLNRWDEAMAFNGLSLLTHLLLPLFPHG